MPKPAAILRVEELVAHPSPLIVENSHIHPVGSAADQKSEDQLEAIEELIGQFGGATRFSRSHAALDKELVLPLRFLHGAEHSAVLIGGQDFPAKIDGEVPQRDGGVLRGNIDASERAQHPVSLEWEIR